MTKVADGPVGAVWVDPRRARRIVAGGADLRVSDDGGRTFAPADAGDVAMHVSVIAASPRDRAELCAATVTHYEPA